MKRAFIEKSPWCERTFMKSTSGHSIHPETSYEIATGCDGAEMAGGKSASPVRRERRGKPMFRS
jgi:hypothetical protein